jgi:thiamine pyrophosphokinase
LGKHEAVVVVAGGPGSRPPALEIPADAAIVAADSGVDRALALGLRVDIAIGDFDSVTAGGLETARAAGAQIERHPPEKDATDLELALDRAITFGPWRILVLGSDAGRLDHLLSMMLLVGSERFAGCELDAALGSVVVHVIRGERRLAGDVGELISLFALHGPANGVTTEGLQFPLRGETLEPGSSRGVSNVFASPDARIALDRGVLLGVRPGDSDRERSTS